MNKTGYPKDFAKDYSNATSEAKQQIKKDIQNNVSNEVMKHDLSYLNMFVQQGANVKDALNLYSQNQINKTKKLLKNVIFR